MTSEPHNSLTLEGPAIQLVPLSLAHLDELCAIGLDPRLWSATTIRVTTRSEMEAYIQAALAAQLAGTAIPFAIRHRATQTLVGTTRFHSIAPQDRRAEIGFTWVTISWQRSRVNTEAKYLLLRHAFESMGCLRVEFRTDAENEQSRRALLRLGAKQEAVFRSYRVSAHRGVRDLAIFSIIESEWPRICTALEAKITDHEQRFPI